MTQERKNIIADKTFAFSIMAINLYKTLIAQNEFVLSKQLLRSATSIGANVEESISAQSKKDFVNKMSIACKEARESKCWIRLLAHSQLVKYDYSIETKEIDEIIRILNSIIKTSKESIYNS